MIGCRKGHYTFSILVFGMVAGVFDVRGQTIIDTISGWNGSSYVNYFYAAPGETQTYGQTITAPAANSVLTSFSFEIEPQVLGASLTFAGYVYAWNSVSGEATGSALYTSSPVTISEPASGPLSFQLVTFNTGGLVLTPGTQYVLFASTTGFTGTDYAVWGQPGSDAYSGGSFVYLNNTAMADWTNLAWSQSYLGTGGDLAFRATLVPEPDTISLLGGGLALVGWALRRRRNCRR